MKYRAEPLKRIQLVNVANHLRNMFNLTNELYFPVIHFLELIMPRWFKEFDYEIICKDKFSDNKHAETDIINKCIRIREDIYYQATNGYGRDRMTIVHEIAHYLLIVKIGVKLYQNFNNERIITYCDPEWQAKALAGEIMCPSYLIKNMTIDQVVKKCGVSEPAAKFALSLCNKNIL